ncbi:hypothetical protein NFI96_027327, partial [Prochilodus magdalenae]
MDTIKRKKPKLIEWLRGMGMVLQHVHSADLITDTDYKRLKDITDVDTRNTELLDTLRQKGEQTCCKFLELLKEPDVNESSPQLREWIATVNSSGSGAASEAPSSSPANNPNSSTSRAGKQAI